LYSKQANDYPPGIIEVAREHYTISTGSALLPNPFTTSHLPQKVWDFPNSLEVLRARIFRGGVLFWQIASVDARTHIRIPCHNAKKEGINRVPLSATSGRGREGFIVVIQTLTEAPRLHPFLWGGGEQRKREQRLGQSFSQGLQTLRVITATESS